MAIQFNCPYCTATIQVPDHAAGKKGTCPQCRTKLVVPAPRELFVPPPAAAPPSQPMFVPAPQFAPSAPTPGAFVPQLPAPAQPLTGVPPFVPQPPEFMPAPGFVPAPGMPMPGFDPSWPVPPSPTIAALPEQPSVSKKYKKKLKQRSGLTVWIPVACVVIFVGALAYIFLKQVSKAEPMTGNLTARRRDDGKLEPALVHRDGIELDENVVDAVLKQLEKGVTLRGETIVLRFQGTENGLKITAVPGQRAELIAVDISGNKKFAAWYARESAGLNDKAHQDVVRAAKKFMQECAEAAARGERKPDYGRYHDELGIAALAMGVGSEVIAIVGEMTYRCVADQAGQLFFLLPVGTQRFELQGREHGKGKTVFPGHFQVRVADAEAASKKTSKKAKSDEKSESDNEGDSEMTTKSFGKAALNDPSAVDESMSEKPKVKKKAERKKPE